MKPKLAHKSILSLIKKCWKIDKKVKNFNDSEEQIGYSLSKSDGQTYMSVCPTKMEVIGGSDDGKLVWNKYVFDIGGFISNLVEMKVSVDNVALATKTKPSIECDQLLFLLSHKKEKICLSVFTRPANDLEPSKKSTHIQESE